MRFLVLALVAGASLTTARLPAAEAETPASIVAILKVAPEGGGNEAAATAWAKLVAAGPDAIVPTLTAFDTATPTAANWLRSAVGAIAERERKSKRALPVDPLVTFIKDAKRNPAARRIAYELYATEAKDAAAKLLPTLIDDPSVEIRRDAIAARLAAVAKGAAGKDELNTLLTAARDRDQVEEIAKQLEELGPKPDLTKHFNYVTEWLVCGPFDSTDRKGFGKPFTPESGVDPAATYVGKAEAKFGWKYAQSSVVHGTVDLNSELGKHKDAAAYAYAVIVSEKEAPVEIRVASQNAVEIFVNGKKAFGRDEYHHGTRMDQHIGKVVLKPGNNEILLKVLQNNQSESWAQVWAFAVRICDSTGGRVPLTQLVTKDGKTTSTPLGALKIEPKKETK